MRSRVARQRRRQFHAKAQRRKRPQARKELNCRYAVLFLCELWFFFTLRLGAKLPLASSLKLALPSRLILHARHRVLK
jgi:hypothetical protein